MAVLLNQSNGWMNPSEFRNNESLSDIVFIVRDARVPCHRLILAASSDLLCGLFLVEPGTTDIILPDYTEKDIIHLLDLVYNGELICNSSDLPVISGLLQLLEIRCDCFTELTIGNREIANQDGYRDVLDNLLLPLCTVYTVDSADPKLLSDCKVMIRNDPTTTDVIMKQLNGFDNFAYNVNETNTDMAEDSVSLGDLEDRDFSSSDDEWKAKCEEITGTESRKRIILKTKVKQPNRKHTRRITSKNKLTKQNQPKREKCRFCDLFYTRGYMPEHEAKDHGIPKESRFACDKCDAKFGYALELQKHSTLHTYGRIMHECKQCPKVFENRRKLSDHVCAVHKLQMCKYCCTNISCATNEHYLVCSERQRILNIPEQKVTSKHVAFRISDAAAPQGKFFKCQECGKEILMESRRGHARKVHGILPFPCSKCDAAFDSHRELHLHQAAHNPNQYSYKCKYCDQYFESPAVRDSHYMKDHKEATIHCTRCDKFIPRLTYVAHSNSHSVFQCDTCGRSFNQHASLRFHQLTHKDSAQWEFKCEQCPKTFKRKDVLQLHVLVKHTDRSLLPHKCSHCSAGFAHKSRLVVHMKKHLRLST